MCGSQVYLSCTRRSQRREIGASRFLQLLVSWPSGQFLSSQYTLASSRRSQRCARIVGARRVSTETTRLTTPREILVLWLRHEALGLVRAVKPATKQRVAAVQNVPFEARKECARRKTLRRSDGCEKGWPSTQRRRISCSQTDPTMVGWFSGSSGVCWYVTMKELACAEHEARSLANKKNSRKRCSCRCDDTDSEVKAAEMLNRLRSQENGTHNT